MSGAGAGAGGFGASFNTSFTDINTGLFGQDVATRRSGSGARTAETTDKVTIDQIGIMKMIDDALKGTSGLAEIFGLEAGAGLFDSSGSSDATGDLIAKIAGELAKVTGVRETTAKEQTTQEETTEQESSGILDTLFPGSGKIFNIF